MAWTNVSPPSDSKSENLAQTETYTLPATGTGYSSVISKFCPNLSNNNRWIAVTLNASAVSGTNLDIALYGAHTETGTKFLLKDAVVADITATGINVGLIDLNAYPATFYFLSWLVDASEVANTIAVTVTGVAS